MGGAWLQRVSPAWLSPGLKVDAGMLLLGELHKGSGRVFYLQT